MKRTSRFPHLLAATLVAIISCFSDQDPAGPAASSPPAALHATGLLGTGLGSGLLYCSPLPYSVATRTFGPDGGTIAVGPHTLTIPAGALSHDVVVSAEVPSDSVNSVRLLPEGLTFAAGKPARLILSYSNCSILGKLLPKRIAYTTDLLQLIQLLPSMDDLLFQRVSAPLEHFSRYAVSW